MNVETFFEKFELLADVPESIARMRNLILELAAQGRLGTQCEDDEPAQELVEFIREHLASLRKKRELRDKPLPNLDNGKLPALPATWTWARLGNLVRYGSPEKVPSAQIPEDAWLLDLEDIEKETSRLLRRKAYSEKPSKSTKASFQSDEVLYGKLRPYLNKVLVADAPGFCTTEIIAIQTFGYVDSEYLCYVLRRPSFVEYANSKTYGINLPRLSTQDAREAPIPLPPLAEQKRIVAKVDALMALLDDLEARQQEREHQHTALARAALARFADDPTPANLEYLFHDSYDITPADLRKSILTMAVQGRLVERHPKEGCASALLNTVKHDRVKAIKSKRMRKPKEVSAYENNLPFELPEHWEWSQLGLLTAPEDNAICDGPFGSKLKTSHYISEPGYAVIRLGNIGEGHFIWGKEGHITKSHYDSLAKNHTREGDLIIAGLADPLLRCCQVPAELGSAVNKADCFRLRLHSGINRDFVCHYLNSPVAKAFASEANHGMTRERVNLLGAKAVPIPIPPLAEQRRIVAKVDRLLSLVVELEARLTRSHQLAADLLDAVVHEMTAAPSPELETVEV